MRNTMKRFFAGALALILSLSAYATTLNPIQLLNPAGSVAGQVIVSSGPSTVAAWGGIGLNGINAIAANTVLANATGSSASPTAFAMPSCTGATNALGYTSGTGIVCNGAINAATLGGATFASPGAIGGTTAAAGSFTTLAASGNDAMLYQNTSTQSIANSSNTTVTGWTKVADRVNANFNAATGVFTAPATGFYHVDAGITFSTSVSAAVNNQYGATVTANGAASCSGAEFAQTTASAVHSANVSCTVSLAAGQTISLVAFQNSGAAVALASSGSSTYISINRVP